MPNTANNSSITVSVLPDLPLLQLCRRFIPPLTQPMTESTPSSHAGSPNLDPCLQAAPFKTIPPPDPRRIQSPPNPPYPQTVGHSQLSINHASTPAASPIKPQGEDGLWREEGCVVGLEEMTVLVSFEEAGEEGATKGSRLIFGVLDPGRILVDLWRVGFRSNSMLPY